MVEDESVEYVDCPRFRMNVVVAEMCKGCFYHGVDGCSYRRKRSPMFWRK